MFIGLRRALSVTVPRAGPDGRFADAELVELLAAEAAEEVVEAIERAHRTGVESGRVEREYLDCVCRKAPPASLETRMIMTEVVRLAECGPKHHADARAPLACALRRDRLR